jgi:magnesium transporter
MHNEAARSVVQQALRTIGIVTPDPSTPASDGLRIRLFDADRTDRQLSFDEALKAKPSTRQLLWIDIEGAFDAAQRDRLAERYGFIRDAAVDLPAGRDVPTVGLHGDHFDLRVAAEPDPTDSMQATWLDIAAGKNVVVTRHPGPLDLLAAINERIAADATIGELDAAEFVASVLDAVVTSYHTAVDRLEDELDDFDTKALMGRTKGDQFGPLVQSRRKVTRLRRLIAGHRALFATIGSVDFGRGIESADPDVFGPVAARYDAVLGSIESAREGVLGSFDILMTRAAQRTNDVVRTLTLVTVMAVPATITAGFLGMNVIVPVSKDDPGSFWLIVAIVIATELAILAVARWRRWV